MILQLLSLLDLFVALTLLVHAYISVPAFILIYASSYLVIKAAYFYTSWTSWVDFIVGVYCLVAILTSSSILSIIAFLWLISKAIGGLVA